MPRPSRKAEMEGDERSEDVHSPDRFRYHVKQPESFEKNRVALQKARAMYVKGYSYEQIFLAYEIPYRIYIKKVPKWDKLREELDERILIESRRNAIEKKAEDFVNLGLDLGRVYLKRLLAEGVNIDVKEFKLVMDSIMAIHRVKQVEGGNPTDIVAYKDVSAEELRRMLTDEVRNLLSDHGSFVELGGFVALPEPATPLTFDVTPEGSAATLTKATEE